MLIASQFRRYYEFKSWENQRYDEGVCFFPQGGSRIENFPKGHADNCAAKRQNTKGWFKPMGPHLQEHAEHDDQQEFARRRGSALVSN